MLGHPAKAVMRVAIHQPNYFPWIGYMYKIHASDTFVFLDDVAFSKGSYTNRCQVRMTGAESTASRWLTVPLDNFKTGTHIDDIRVTSQGDWYTSHIAAVNAYYRNAPFMSEVLALLHECANVVESEMALGRLNIALVKVVAEHLGLSANWVNSSALDVSTSGQQRVIDLVKTLGGNTYLSGKGAHAYQDSIAFEESGIDLEYHDMSKWLEQRDQRDTALGTYSVIDTLCHIGRDGVVELLNDFHQSGLARRNHSELTI